MSDLHEPRADQSAPAGHEPSDASVGGIITFTIGLVVFLVGTDVALRWWFGKLMSDDMVAVQPLAGDPNTPIISPPRLQRLSNIELAQLRSDEDLRLSTYGLVDRQQQIARMPIDAAMKLVAEKKLPKWPKAARTRPPGASNDTPSSGEKSSKPERQP